MDDEEEAKLSEMQKIEMAKWFLVNSPPGEIQYVAKDIRSVLMDERMYAKATLEAFPLHNKFHMISLEMPNRSGQVIVTEFSELDETHYLDPRTAQVATVNHVKQVCTEVRPAADVELASVYVEEFRNGCWRSVWKIDFKDDVQAVELNGKLGVVSHYFEEGNVQLDTCYECKESIAMQTPEECASSITSIIRHHESEYLASLEESYSKLSDTTFKVFQDLMELRRKLPVTRTLFPWNNTLQLSFTRDLTKELGLGK
ncbi:F-actin-capping protein subunit alpha isoform X3 [Cryptomeria japonica]|uniref:F-actin-capping protein subunit alpha isoform X3 n=1 Tax=Cryptomeria japonica TaxID=3369 RepID=UPI0025AC2D6E|nr:F-actin-capping protein subunit alpha isoform X3 [Cryptomeria japonica]